MTNIISKYLKKSLEDKKLLLIGAGGIGCEVVKNLINYQFKELHIVDLDQIELTNLNRQFYFRKEHIGKNKASVIKNIINVLAPHIDVIDHPHSIYKEKFNVKFFGTFDAVIMALDNIEARQHVNKMCQISGVVAFDAGTNGLNG